MSEKRLAWSSSHESCREKLVEKYLSRSPIASTTWRCKPSSKENVSIIASHLLYSRNLQQADRREEPHLIRLYPLVKASFHRAAIPWQRRPGPDKPVGGGDCGLRKSRDHLKGGYIHSAHHDTYPRRVFDSTLARRRVAAEPEVGRVYGADAAPFRRGASTAQYLIVTAANSLY